MYRAVGLFYTRRGTDIKNDKQAVISLLSQINIDIKYIDDNQHIFLNGEDVTDKIRTPEISMAASDSGTVKEIRERMTVIQRRLAEEKNCVMDGRDIGSYVLPFANVKIFLTAGVAIRAERRYKELTEKGTEVTYDEVLSDMIRRDENDSNREFMPLKAAEDAVVIDSSDLSLEESVKAVLSAVKDGLK